MKRLPYREGSCFAVPLRQGGYALGVVARMAQQGKIVLAYFFGPKLDSVPSLLGAAEFRAGEAIKCLRVGDLGLLNGEWILIGELPHWHRDDWPMPELVRRDDSSKRAWRVRYADSDPSAFEDEEEISYESDRLETAGLYGYGAVEIILTKRLQLNN